MIERSSAPGCRNIVAGGIPGRLGREAVRGQRASPIERCSYSAISPAGRWRAVWSARRTRALDLVQMPPQINFGGEDEKDDCSGSFHISTCSRARGPVQCLQLKDLDWEREVIHITRTKPRSVSQYPLLPAVGEAILRYLQKVRLRHPRHPSRCVFLTLRAPYRPLGRSALWKVVSDRLRPLDP
jgi:hypothetical protein